jgi:hypothetical protein
VDVLGPPSWLTAVDEESVGVMTFVWHEPPLLAHEHFRDGAPDGVDILWLEQP